MSIHAPSSLADGPADNPFRLDARDAYARWRERKLASRPNTLDELVVEVDDPRHLTPAEHAAILTRCRRANLALYASPCREEDKTIPRLLGEQFGLHRLDNNFLADEDGITSLAVGSHGGRGDFIPYTNRPIKWHTDGYYNPMPLQVRGIILHCVRNAAEGGENALLDHELAYLRLRDRDPELVRALMAEDAMTIPPREDSDGVARPVQSGPVFSLLASGDLHMRYTARTVSIVWKDNDVTRAAVKALEEVLASASADVLRGTLEPGMGLIANNILHDRSGFADDPEHPRLLYRARYHDRIAGTLESWRA